MENFSYEANGYNRHEVNQFVNEVIHSTEDIIVRCKKQEEEIERLKVELHQYKMMEDTLKTAILEAKDASKNIKDMAKRESEIIIKDAKNNASYIINDALIRAFKIESNVEILQKNIGYSKSKLNDIIKQQLAIIDQIELLNLDSR